MDTACQWPAGGIELN